MSGRIFCFLVMSLLLSTTLITSMASAQADRIDIGGGGRRPLIDTRRDTLQDQGHVPMGTTAPQPATQPTTGANATSAPTSAVDSTTQLPTRAGSAEEEAREGESARRDAQDAPTITSTLPNTRRNGTNYPENNEVPARPANAPAGTTEQMPKGHLEACLSAQKKARLACATLSLTGMDPGTAGAMEMMLMQSIQIQAAMRSQGSAEQCKSAQDLNKIMAAVTAAKTAACAALMNKCNNQCGDASSEYSAYKTDAERGLFPGERIWTGGTLTEAQAAENARNQPINTQRATTIQSEYLRPVRNARNMCQEFKGNMAMMMGQLMQQGMSMVQSGRCQDNLATNTSPTPSFTPVATPPTISTNNMSCDTPAGATRIDCICQKTPDSPMCKNAGGPTVFGPGGGNPVGGGVPTGGDIGSSGDLGSDGDIVDNAPLGKGTGGSQTSGDNGGGGLGGSGGGGGGAFGDDGGFGGPSGINKDVITGQSGGGGGSSGGGGIAATSGGGGGGGKSSGGDYGGGGGSGFNLNKFLPGQYKGRGVAGMSIEAKDGVTGPMGPSIWEKVSNQYQQQKSSMYQDR